MMNSLKDYNFSDRDRQFLMQPHSSSEDFAKKYKKFYLGQPRAQELHLLYFLELQKAISTGKVQNLQRFSTYLDFIRTVEDEDTLKSFYDNVNNPLKGSNLVIIICKLGKVEVLEYVLQNDILVLFPACFGLKPIMPTDVDEECHNAFYYAIRSGNTQLLSTLINNWPEDYFTVHKSELGEILEQCYGELKLKNVLIAKEMGFFVEDKLIDLRFFSTASVGEKVAKTSSFNVIKRVELVLQNITTIVEEYSGDKGVDGKFIFLGKWVAQNIHVLKRQLRSTYDQLPWEEMEFCLITFVSSQIHLQEINFFYSVTINKGKVLKYLEMFGARLAELKDGIGEGDFKRFETLPYAKRERIVAQIVKKYPEFQDLYTDFQQMRDLYTLDKIHEYIELAVNTDPLQKEGELVIIRALQGIGEHLKNTLESPKLSAITSELVLLTLPKNTRDLIINIRNSLSHAYSKEADDNQGSFFAGVQKDMQILSNIIVDINIRNKINIIKNVLQKVMACETLAEMKEAAGVFGHVDKISAKMKDIKLDDQKKIEEVVRNLKKAIPNMTTYEQELMKKIKNSIQTSDKKSQEMIINYALAGSALERLQRTFIDRKIDQDYSIRFLKYYVSVGLENFPPEVENLKSISENIMQVLNSAEMRMVSSDRTEISRLKMEIMLIAQFGSTDLKWIEDLKKKMEERKFLFPENRCMKPSEEKVLKLEEKLCVLEGILKNNGLSTDFLKSKSGFWEDKELQAAVEMSLLDVMSILDGPEKRLDNNLLFFDCNTPLLTGKCLRNHLAHDNNVLDVQFSDPAIAVISNANHLITKDIIKTKIKIGNPVKDDPIKIRDKCAHDLISIDNQEKLFTAIGKGDWEEMKRLLALGGDLHGRRFDQSTAVHFAVRGADVELLKFLIEEGLPVDVMDLKGQNPLHIAATYGRANIIEFLIKETTLTVDCTDTHRKSPLHFAAKHGQVDAIQMLLKHKADPGVRADCGHPPLMYAVDFNHLEAVKLLVNKDNVDFYEGNAGLTALYLSAERGDMAILEYLLELGANVHAKGDDGGQPLHVAAQNGHLEIVKLLISKGADVNNVVLDGKTALFSAVEFGQEEVARFLIKNRAKVGPVSKPMNFTPLHFAADQGNENMVKILLESKADPHAKTVIGDTPLHVAARRGHLNICELLIKYKSNVRGRNLLEFTPLQYAVSFGHEKVATLLIEKGASVFDKGLGNTSVLYEAASNGFLNIVELFIKNGVDLEVRNDRGSTALHGAALNGKKDVLELLIRHGANVNADTYEGMAAIHAAAGQNWYDILQVLLKNGVKVDKKNKDGLTALHYAALSGHAKIVNLLINNGANVNMEANTLTPLSVAVEGGHKEVVQILLENGAYIDFEKTIQSAIVNNNKDIVDFLVNNVSDVHFDEQQALSMAIFVNAKEIIDILIQNMSNVNKKCDINGLHIAATKGNKDVLNVLLAKGAAVDATTNTGVTALFFACQEGHDEIVEILIAKGANVNFHHPQDGTPLQLAVERKHLKVVEILLNNGANVHLTNSENQSPLFVALATANLPMVKLLIENSDIDVNAAVDEDGITILHIAATFGNIKCIKYLVGKGCRIDSQTIKQGAKPIHCAARAGFTDVIKYFLKIGLQIDDAAFYGYNLLHFAAMGDQVEVAKFLISEGMDKDCKNNNGDTAMHVAAMLGHKKFVMFLLEIGAIYNTPGFFEFCPIKFAKDEAKNELIAAEFLMEAVRNNNCLEVKKLLKKGGYINARHAVNGTPLHFAAYKGFEQLCEVLLLNNGNPNAVGNKGYTPLHYAARFSHIKIVKCLLMHGAIYNIAAESGKTPLDISEGKEVSELLKLVDECFKKVESGRVQVVNDINKIRSVEVVKIVMRACNSDGRTLIVAAEHSKFSNIDKLKAVRQDEVAAQITYADLLAQKGDYQKALNIYRSAYEKRMEILGPDNPGTLDIQSSIARMIFRQSNFEETYRMMKEIHKKQKELLGENHKDTLSSNAFIPLVMHRLGKDNEAIVIFREVYKKQKEILGEDHLETITTLLHTALSLQGLGKFDEMLKINQDIYEKRVKAKGKEDMIAVTCQNNIAQALCGLKQYDEAIRIYKEVHEKRKKIIGVNHEETLRPLHNIGATLLLQKKYSEAQKALQDVLVLQKKALPQCHHDIIRTQNFLADIYVTQEKFIAALKIYREIIDQARFVYGPSHPIVLKITQDMMKIDFFLKMRGRDPEVVLLQLQNEINTAANNGDYQTIRRLVKAGADVNDTDAEGRTPLHFAIGNGHKNVVSILIKFGANITQVTNKGNTTLHTAALKSYKGIVEMLLKYVNRAKVNDFINAKTYASGTTALHLAAKNGSLEIVKILLNRGAIYNIVNKEKKKPVEVVKDESVKDLLNRTEELFKGFKTGKIDVNLLKEIEKETLVVISNARDCAGKTLMQIAVGSGKRDLARVLLEAIRESEPSL